MSLRPATALTNYACENRHLAHQLFCTEKKGLGQTSIYSIAFMDIDFTVQII
jgi:hypothetical protein